MLKFTGTSGNDTISVSNSFDIFNGGGGNDVFIVNSNGIRIVEDANNGIDTVQSSVFWRLRDNFENLILTGPATWGMGNELDNRIVGNAADNSLFGLAGNDTLDGGLGADEMAGGSGNDVYVVDSEGDRLLEFENEGIDTVRSSVSWTLDDDFENLTLTGTVSLAGTGNQSSNALTGNDGANVLSGLDGNDTILGLAGNDTLDGGNGTDSMDGGTGNDSLLGGAGNDTLNGGEGLDKLSGGLGNDTYIVDATTDMISESANEGTDTVVSSANFYLSANIENLTLTGTVGITGMGNAGANVITGNSVGNALIGYNGNDTLDGRAGNDVLFGGSGADRLIGGVGNDNLTGGTESDTFVFTTGFGKDTVSDFNAADGVNHDVLLFSTAVFANWNALLAKTTQVGTDLVITQNASNTITLKNVTLSSFTSDDAIFIA